MNIQNLSVNEIYEYEKNPRDNEPAVAAVAESIEEFGFRVPIIVDKNNVIIAGHTRLKAAKQLGMTEVPVIQAADLTEKQVKAFRIADNKTNEFAEWNMELLTEELKGLDDIFTGFDTQEYDDLMALGDEAEDDDFELEVPEVAKSKHGQIYELGRHRLMVGDSTSIKDVEKLMNYELADLVVTDPPYNVNYEGQGGMTIQGDDQDDASFLQFLIDAFTAMSNSLKPGGAYYIWHADTNRYTFSKALLAVDMKERQNLIWIKSSLVMGRQDYQWIHEPVLYGWKPGAAHYFVEDYTNTTVMEDLPKINQMTKDELKDYVKELRKQLDEGTTIIREDKPHSSDLHPTMKPVPLMGENIRNSSRRNEVVLDLFGGSGSTLMAAEQLGRICNIMELEPRYADVIINRWEKYTGGKAKLIEE